jgi:hypothetical protein
MINTPIDDGGTGSTIPTGGSTGGPAIVDPRWADINWSFPVPLESQIIGFDVVAYTGSDANDASTYLFTPMRVNPSVRRCIKSFAPPADLATVNAAVRAIYA